MSIGLTWSVGPVRDRRAEWRRSAERGRAPIRSRQATALHESAHAVLARVFDLKAGMATITLDTSGYYGRAEFGTHKSMVQR